MRPLTKLIGPGVEHINQPGGVVAGALPLLYGMAEEIMTDVTPRPEQPAVPEPARPASGTRRSRCMTPWNSLREAKAAQSNLGPLPDLVLGVEGGG